MKKDFISRGRSISDIKIHLVLNLRSPQNLYDQSLFKVSTANLHRAALIQQYFPHSFNLYLQLHQQATMLDQTPAMILEDHSQTPLFLQNWQQPITQVRMLRAWSKLKRAATRKQLKLE